MTTAQMSHPETTQALPAPPPHAALPSPEKPKGSILRTIIILLVIAGFVGFAVWRIMSNKKAQQAEGGAGGGRAAFMNATMPVAVVPVQQRTMPIYLTALGTVTAYNTVTIKSRVDGQLMKVYVNEGQSVSQGQLLMQIDPAPFQASLAQAEGNLARDQATANNARQQANRYDQLYAAGVVSREQAQTQDATAGQAEGAVKADQAAIQTAKVNLNYTRITSPISGIVGLRQVDPGNIVSASGTAGLLVITQVHPIAVIFTLPEDQLPEVLKRTRGGRTLAVEAYDRSNSTLLAKGKLLTADNQIDTTTGTAKFKAVFDNTDNALFPNQFVNVRLVLEERQNAIVIPSAAVQNGTAGPFVYVVKEGNPPANLAGPGGPGGPGGGRRGGNGGGQGGPRPDGAGAGGPGAGQGQRPAGPPHYAEVRQIKVDLTEGPFDIISDGLKPGEQVITDGAERLRNGSRVIPRAANPATGNALPFTPGAGNGQGGRGGRGNAPGGAGAPAAEGNSAQPRGERRGQQP